MIDMNNMVKLISADMDGTLLNSKGELNSEFFSVFEQMKSKGITFVVASGRQHYNLLSLFDRIKNEAFFIAENGTYVVYRGQELLISDLPLSDVREVIPQVRKIEQAYPVLCGKNQAYVEDDYPDFVKQVRTYYQKCTIVPDLLDVTNDKFLKIAIYDFDGSATNSYPALEHFNQSLKVVVSGKNWMDISNQQANKGEALKFIQDFLHVKKDECMAFGDQMNDAEMLQNVSFSYAMENASDELKSYAHYQAPSNDSNGVLVTIQEFLSKFK